MLAETAGAAIATGGGAVGAIWGCVELVKRIQGKRNGHCNGNGPKLCMRHAERLTAVETRLEGLDKNVDAGFRRIEGRIDDVCTELKRRNE